MLQTPKLGRVQLRIMQVLWRRGKATAREITDDLNAQGANRDAVIAHSTVQTLLRKLENKGAVRHEVEERTFVFVPVHQENEIASGAAGDLLARLFDRSISGLVAHLLQHEKVSPEELGRLRQLIEAAEAAQDLPQQKPSQPEAP